jgi:hypothetical protein
MPVGLTARAATSEPCLTDLIGFVDNNGDLRCKICAGGSTYKCCCSGRHSQRPCLNALRASGLDGSLATITQVRGWVALTEYRRAA